MLSDCTSKKKILEQIAHLASEKLPHLSSADVLESLMNREKLGSTGIGEGIALPHSRLPHCEDTLGALFLLDEPIDFDSIDRKPVDLVFVLLVPEEATEQHLQTLSMLAENSTNQNFATPYAMHLTQTVCMMLR